MRAQSLNIDPLSEGHGGRGDMSVIKLQICFFLTTDGKG
jgi:hypothetical protein